MPIGLWDDEAPIFSIENRLTDISTSALRARSPLPPSKILVFISVRSCVDLRATIRLEELGKLKNPTTSSGLQHAIFRFAVKCLISQLCYRVPPPSAYPSWTSGRVRSGGTRHQLETPHPAPQQQYPVHRTQAKTDRIVRERIETELVSITSTRGMGSAYLSHGTL
jgi:hypothetical protein